MNIWLARDNDDRLYMHFVEPQKGTLSGGTFWSEDYVDITGTSLDTKMENLDFEGSPVKLNVYYLGDSPISS